MHERMRQALSTAVAMTLAVALGGTALAQSVGTWKLNVAKSSTPKDRLSRCHPRLRGGGCRHQGDRGPSAGDRPRGPLHLHGEL